MSDFINLCRARRSVRHYETRPVEEEKIDYILNCALRAPSAVNYQPWRLIVVRDKTAKQALATCYNREWFKNAPLYIIVCTDEAVAWTRKGDGKNHGDIDAAIIAEHIVLAVTATGLGSCWVCNFDTTEMSHFLKQYVNENTHAVAILPIGYPSEESQATPISERLPKEEIIQTI